MLHHDLIALRRILQKVLLIVNDGLFLSRPDEIEAIRRDLSICSSSALAQVENDWNRLTLDYTLGHNAYARWQNNLSLMLLVESHIKRLLLEMNYGKETRLFITNELAATDCDGHVEGIEIIPRLRLWTRANDHEDYLYHAINGDKSGLDMITVRGERKQLFVPTGEVFTVKGEIKKSFVKRLQGLAGWEPQRTYLP